MDEIKLKYFISAARHLSFTKAAEDCHVTQSTISKQISALEEELGAQLFFRNNSAVILTLVGERLALKAEDYMEQYRFINESVHNLHLGQEQRLTIGVGPWEHAILAHPLEVFSKRHPNVEINTTMYTYKRIASHLRSGTIDVGLCTSLCTNAISGMRVVVLGHNDWEIAAHESAPFWTMPAEDRTVLKNQIVITLYQNEYEPVRHYCVKNNMQTLAFTYSNISQTLIAMVRAGLGITIMPSFLHGMTAGDIRTETITGVPLTMEHVVVCNAKSYSAAAKNFVDVCEEVYQGNFNTLDM